MTRTRFHQNLDDLKERLLVMAGMAEQATQRAIEAYRVGDISICDLVMRSSLRSTAWRETSIRWRSICLPWSSRWRSIFDLFLSVIKINADLERVGDRAVKNQRPGSRPADCSCRSNCPSIFPSWRRWRRPWCEMRCRLLLTAMRHWRRSVLLMDDDVDELNRAIFHTLTRSDQRASPSIRSRP